MVGNVSDPDSGERTIEVWLSVAVFGESCAASLHLLRGSDLRQPQNNAELR